MCKLCAPVIGSKTNIAYPHSLCQGEDSPVGCQRIEREENWVVSRTVTVQHHPTPTSHAHAQSTMYAMRFAASSDGLMHGSWEDVGKRVACQEACQRSLPKELAKGATPCSTTWAQFTSGIPRNDTNNGIRARLMATAPCLCGLGSCSRWPRSRSYGCIGLILLCSRSQDIRRPGWWSRA